jgi:hypothetical protein
MLAKSDHGSLRAGLEELDKLLVSSREKTAIIVGDSQPEEGAPTPENPSDQLGQVEVSVNKAIAEASYIKRQLELIIERLS